MSEEILDKNEQQLLEAMGLDDDGAYQDYVAYSGTPKPDDEEVASETAVIEALKTVSDPEIMVNIYDMGLVYKIEINPQNGDVNIDMTVTAPTCPVAGILPQQAADAVASVPGTGKIAVKIVWEPAWTPEKMSEEAKAMFELF